MTGHDWCYVSLDWPGTETRFRWRCSRCGAAVTTSTSYHAGSHVAYLHMPEWRPRIGWEPDCDVEAARLVHES